MTDYNIVKWLNEALGKGDNMSFFEEIMNFLGFGNQENQDDAVREQLENDMHQNLMEQQNAMEEAQRELDTMEQEAMMRQIEHDTNPYENPGMDTVVDESYFGIDEGLGIVNPDYGDMDNNNSFDDAWNDSSYTDSWSDDSSSDDSFFDSSSDDSFFDSGWSDDGF